MPPAQGSTAQASAVARALSAEDGAGEGAVALSHRARGLSLAVEVAVSAGDGPGARMTLSDLSAVDPEGAAEMALAVAVAFPDEPVTLAPTVPQMAADAAGKAGTEADLSLVVGPNPSAGAVQVSVATGEADEATVAVFDALGREVAVLHDGPASGALALSLDGAALPAGLYVVRAVVRQASAVSVLTRTVVLAR